MNYERSLDEIIKLNKSKTQNRKKPGAQKKFQPLKSKKNENKLSKAGINKSNVTSFKSKSPKRRDRKLTVPDARMKISGISDARLKILKNRNRIVNTKNRGPLVAAKSTIADARLKIEAHKRQKFTKPKPQNRNFGVTRFAADGILLRKINVNSSNDNGVYVEYEDDDMNLEYETLRKDEWKEKPFLVRRTVQNNQRRNALKSPTMHDDRMYREYSRTGSSPPYNDLEVDDLSYKDLKRTIPNSGYRKVPANPSRTFPKRSSPVRQYSYDNDHEMRSSRLSPVSHPSPMTRNAPYHLLVISNLHENVTGEDIKELFEDVGDLVYAKMTKSGVAEVAYKSHKDATQAVEIYHNRQLDGLPMKCTLVSHPHETSSRFHSQETSSSRYQKESSTSRYIPPVNTLSPVEPDSRIIKKALFSSR